MGYLNLLDCRAFLRAVLHVLPVFSPLLSPFKWTPATLTYLGWETVLYLGVIEATKA